MVDLAIVIMKKYYLLGRERIAFRCVMSIPIVISHRRIYDDYDD